MTGILSENGHAFEGPYRINNGQQGILRATATPTISAPPPPLIGRLTLPAKPPSSESDALVVVRHGCCTPPGSNIKIWQDMANKLQGPGRAVWLYSWQEESGLLFAMYNAAAHGKHLGKVISASSYKYVHFIGHSAASNLIHHAIKAIKTDRDKFVLNDPIIHATFLDAFTPPVYELFYGEDLEGADYAEDDVDFGLRKDRTDQKRFGAACGEIA